MTDWIKHDSSEPPELAPAALVEWLEDCGSYDSEIVRETADKPPWFEGSVQYRQPRDEDGIPYISADGLEPWAEYVATDEDGEVTQFYKRPSPEPEFGFWIYGSQTMGAYCVHRHPGDWRESLYRVWRD